MAGYVVKGNPILFSGTAGESLKNGDLVRIDLATKEIIAAGSTTLPADLYVVVGIEHNQYNGDDADAACEVGEKLTVAKLLEGMEFATDAVAAGVAIGNDVALNDDHVLDVVTTGTVIARAIGTTVLNGVDLTVFRYVTAYTKTSGIGS